MGLLDVINGMQNGPRGQPQPSSGSASGGMSPITMALMGLLAYKAIKGFGGPGAAASSSPATMPSGSGAGGGLGGLLGGGGGGSLGDLLSGGLGGLFGGGSSVGGGLSGGLGNLINDLQKSGQGHVAQSWVGNGPNQAISPASLESALGGDAVDALSKQTGMDRNELLSGISQYLPGLVDHLTPNGRLPTPDEAARMSR
jgi:uncharacterized protein YidB (DUF937 family)